MVTDVLARSGTALRHKLRRMVRSEQSLREKLRQTIGHASEADLDILRAVRPYTMTSNERLWALLEAVRYVHKRGLAGDFVECGVWRGGSSMAAAMGFRDLGDFSRDLWLFDTFEGMSEPTDFDVRLDSGEPAIEKWRRTREREDAETANWCAASLEDVTRNLGLTGYPAERVHYVQGKVEETLLKPENAPAKISILRLDTDWYESTKVEMEILFERLEPGGVLILDDYGHWAGAKKAVDEFLATQPPYLMHRIDYSGRMLVKA